MKVKTDKPAMRELHKIDKEISQMKDLPEMTHDARAERAVLGEILLEGGLSYAKDLKADDFYETKHQTIFKAMRDMSDKAEAIDFVTLCNYLKNTGELDGIGGPSEITALSSDAITTALMPSHIRIVKEEAFKRQIIAKTADASSDLKNADLTAFVSDMRAFYTDLALTPAVEEIEFFDIDKLLTEGKAYAQKGKETGIRELDKAVKIMPKELIIIGARVRHGKSSLAYNILLNFLENYDKEAFIFFNLDVPSTIVMSRLATIWAKKHKAKTFAYKDVLPSFQTQRFEKEILEAFGHFDKYGKEKRLAIVNKPQYTVEQIISHAERLAKEKPLGAIFIDYIELIKTKQKQDTEELRVSYIVNQLRIASERLSCPVIVLAQMNRDASKDKKPEKRRPVLEGIRYSGRQEQEASTVLGLFNIASEKLEIGQQDGIFTPSPTSAELEIIPLKNRGGESNRIISLDFDMVSGHIKDKASTGFEQ